MNKSKIIYRALKGRIISFSDSHNIHTPQSLVEKILNNVDLKGNILVLFNLEFIVSLIYTYNVPIENITFYSDHINKNFICDELGIKYITSLEIDMKFDLILANPPYNSGDFLLYPTFFKQSLDIAETVVMVMPTDLNSQQVRLKKHNELVKKHMTAISDNVTDYFEIGRAHV